MLKGKRSVFTIIKYLLIIAVIIFTGLRMTATSTVNQKTEMASDRNAGITLTKSNPINISFTIPTENATGLSLQYEGKEESLENKHIQIEGSIHCILNDSTIDIDQNLELKKQAYDYQNDCYTILMPFDQKLQRGDQVQITIIGKDLQVNDHIIFRSGNETALENAFYTSNNEEQEGFPCGYIYFQTTEKKQFSPFIQGVVTILLILLVSEVWKTRKQYKKTKSDKPAVDRKKTASTILVVCLLLLVLLEYVYYAGVRPHTLDWSSKELEEVSLNEASEYSSLESGEAYTIKDTFQENHLGGFAVYIQNPYIYSGSMTLVMTDFQTGNVVASTRRQIRELSLKEEDCWKIIFDSEAVKTKGKEYQISLTYNGEESVELLTGQDQQIKLIPLYKGIQNLDLLAVFLGLSTLVLLSTSFIIVLAHRKVKLETLAFVAIISLGLIFEIIITPFAAPDEKSHMDTSYRISNQILGIEDTGMVDTLYKRKCDINSDYRSRVILSTDNYKWICDEVFKTEGKSEFGIDYAADNTSNATNAIFFLPAAIGLSFGRILGLGFLPMFYLARIVNLIIAALMIYFGIRKIPFGKSILSALALLPIVIQQIIACSYDSLLIGTVALYLAYCIYAIYSEKKLTKQELLVIAITAILIGVCKGCVYTPLYLLIIYAGFKKGYIRFPHKKISKIICGICLLGVACIVIMKVMALVQQPINDLQKLWHDSYSLSYLLQHPAQTYRIVQNTIYYDLERYLEQCMGREMGPIQITAGFLMPISYTLLLAATVMQNNQTSLIMKKRDKVVFLLAGIASIGVVLFAFLVVVTPYGYTAIGGLQGRYFVPILWLLLISLRSNKIIYKDKPYHKLMSIGFIIGIVTSLQLIINIMNY